MKNKFILGIGISLLVLLSSIHAKTYLWTTPLADAVQKAMEFGVDQSTAQKMHDDGVQERFIRPEFVKSWEKDKQGQIPGSNHIKALNKKFSNPALISAQEKVKLLTENLEKGHSLQLFEIKKSLSTQEFMAYTDILWHRKTGMPLLKHRPEFNKNNKNTDMNRQQGIAATVGSGNDCDFPNLLIAVNFAADGGSIFVAAETFTGINAKLTINKNLSITGGLDSNCQVFTANRTVLDLGQTGPVISVDVSGGNTVTLSGLEITGATNDGSNFTSGIYATGDGTLNIGNSHIHDNQSSFGGGIAIESDVTLNINDSSEIYANNAVQSGGGIYCDSSTIKASDTLIGRFNGVAQGNTVNSLGLGGGIYAETCSLNLGDDVGDNAPVEVSYNHANSGGGLYLAASTLQFTHPQSRVSFNTSGAVGVGEASGIYARQNSLMDLFDLKITDNSPNVGVGLSTSFINATSYCNSSPCLEISRNSEEGFYLTDGAGIDVSHAVMSNNCKVVGVNSLTQVNVVLQNSNIINHQGNEPLISVESPLGVASAVNLSYVTVANNQITGGLFDSKNDSLVNSEAVVIWGNTSTDLFAAGANGGSVSNSVIQYNPAGMTNTVQQDPTFVDANNGDFHILPTSPAIDRSNLVTLTDINGEGRPQGNAYDAGSDENGKRIGINGAACQYSSISAAVAAASANDTIYIVPGAYHERIGEINKNLDFISALNDCSNVDPTLVSSDVTVNGDGILTNNGGIVSLLNAAEVSFTNMTLTNASSNGGGIIRVNEQSSLTLDDVIISNGNSSLGGNGGNVSIVDSSILNLMGDTAIISGVSDQGGGISIISSTLNMWDTAHVGIEDFGNMSNYIGSGIMAIANSSVYMNDQSYIRSNVGTSSGGGIYVRNSSVIMKNQSSIGTAFDSGANFVETGAGIYIVTSDGLSASLTVQDQAKIQHNHSTDSGAGVYANGEDITLNFDSGSVNDNWITASSDVLGSGIYLVNPSPGLSTLNMGAGFNVSNNDWSPITLRNYGGGVSLSGANVEATITGAIITGNRASKGAGIALLEGATATLNQTSITQNFAEYTALDGEISIGGGIYVKESGISITEGMLNNNTAGLGGGIALSDSNAQFNGGEQGLEISNNQLLPYNGIFNAYGAGLVFETGTYQFNGPITVANNTIPNDGVGGGLSLFTDVNMIQTSTAFGSLNVTNNTAQFGGGISLRGNATMQLDKAKITNNSVTNSGGGIYLQSSSSASLLNSKIDNNQAGSGAGMLIRGTATVSMNSSIACRQAQTASDYCSRISNNSATSNIGHAIEMTDLAQFNTKGTVINNHPQAQSNAINLDGTDAIFNATNVLFADNGNVGIDGGDSTVILQHTTHNNSGLTLNTLAVNTNVSNSIIWDSPVSIPNGIAGSCNISPNAELTGGSGDPLFKTELQGPYHLGANSPAVDACLTTSIIDLDGKNRPIDSDGIASSSESDMGAFERQLFATLDISVTGMGTIVSDVTGINCGNDCTEEYELGTALQLQATPAAGYVLESWSGSCAGQSNTCFLTLNSNENIQVTFVKEYTVTVSVVQETGIGHVESSIPGIFCGNNGTNCVANYSEGTVLLLNASADNANSAFSHWTGDCQGQTASCSLTINSDIDTTAYFVNPDIIFRNGFEPIN